MISEPAFEGKPFRNGLIDDTELFVSNSFVIFGDCHHHASFHVPVSGGSGRGAIVSFSNKLSISTLSFVESSNQTGKVVLESAIPGNAFDMFQPKPTTSRKNQTFPFRFQNVTDNGATLRIACAQSGLVEFVVMIRDDSDLQVDAHIEFDKSGDQRVELNRNVKSEVNLEGKSKSKTEKEAAQFTNASTKGITIHHEKSGGVVIVQMQVRNAANGKLVHRSIIIRTRKPPIAVTPMTLLKSELDGSGDLVFKFLEIGKLRQALKIDSRIGIAIDQANTLKECVDLSAIVEDYTLIVHNEWIRQCMNESGLTNQTVGWDVVILNATATDPEDGYRTVAQLENIAETGIRHHEAIKREKLSNPPLTNKITQEMREGRKPNEQQRRRLRLQSPVKQTPRHSPHQPPQQPSQQRPQQRSEKLSRPHAKVLVHGYCAPSNPFPTSEFTNYIAFHDPSDPASWSNDLFARKIANFTSHLGGCGCIAHSQGGAACLHLKTFYHSCLDSPAVKGRVIQSVGTPYQGTALAGTLAALGQVFGAGCGYNIDLTYFGAQTWLLGIPSWARSQVHYYTTSFKDTQFDCNFAAEFVISNPNDGATEVWADQLPDGGNNMGNTEGWCHIGGMSDPPQYTDPKRNAVMNAHAQY